MFVRNTLTDSLVPEIKAFISGHLGCGRDFSAREVNRTALPPVDGHEPDPKAVRKGPGDGMAVGS